MLLKPHRQGYQHWCEGCKELHYIPTSEKLDGAQWEFDHNFEAPTFRPSVHISTRSKVEPYVCHYIITAGRIAYCGDCTHHLVNQIMDLSPIPIKYRGA